MRGVRLIGIDETSIKRGHQYVTVVHDLAARHLLYIAKGRGARDGDRLPGRARSHTAAIRASSSTPAWTWGRRDVKGVREHLFGAQMSFGRYPVIALTSGAMEEVRRRGRAGQARLRQALGILTSADLGD